MRYYLENDQIKAEIDSFGAELKSVMGKSENREYMWYGNKKYWGRTSPVLFPFVGSLKNGSYTWKGQTYPMGQHGFARDFEHKLISQTENEIWFSFASDEETKKRYPFAFELQCGYRLEGDTLHVLWRVCNPSNTETMYFSIGAHPAFLCPIHGEKDHVGYRLRFAGVDTLHYHGNVVSTGMAILDDETMELENERAVITDTFFDKCTYFVEGKQTSLVGLEDPEGKKIVDVIFDTPLFAIWSPEGKKAPFLCIEPWYGRCDADSFEGDLSEREYTNELAPGEVFEGSYSMIFYGGDE